MRIALEGSGDFIDCTMTDLSAAGARLDVAKGIELPDYFVLVLSHDGHLRRQCSVAWRSPTSVGVEFIPFDPMNKSGS
ncbi:MAG: PilZ domain-containing protein [Hyphomicrobiales bacterium]|jgi:PilZ domain|nr:PilZ domain-containing protein [Hyphomicrobiales bacterium]MDE1974179.1 PilZ domain-containing protein [Hyphomicrobiales bacterium]MDE2285866.1 PilZ domain-containing protein [Hyphomicrobiales bacterium]